MYKAVIFDLDGTLVHTLPEYRYTVVGRVLVDLGVTVSKQDIDRFWFETERNDVIRKKFGLEPDIFWPKFRQYDTKELRGQYTKLYDDVDFVKELKTKGYKLGIVTGAPAHIVSLEIGMIGKEDFDSVIMAYGSNGIPRKPHPQGLYDCLNELSVEKHEAIFVGNADEDVMAAKNAEVFDVFLARGEHEFPDVTPSLKISSLYELRKFLKF